MDKFNYENVFFVRHGDSGRIKSEEDRCRILTLTDEGIAQMLSASDKINHVLSPGKHWGGVYSGIGRRHVESAMIIQNGVEKLLSGQSFLTTHSSLSGGHPNSLGEFVDFVNYIARGKSCIAVASLEFMEKAYKYFTGNSNLDYEPECGDVLYLRPDSGKLVKL